MKNVLNNINFKPLTPYIIITALILFFFLDVVFFNQNFFWRDLLSHSYPAKKILINALEAGYYPLWNPYIGVGIPYLADLSNQPLYFLNILFILFPSGLAMNATIILHYLFCAIFTYLFIKDLTKNPYIGIFAGISFSLSGYCISLSCNLEYLSAIIWLPATLWAFYRSIDTEKIIYLFLTALFLSMFIFGGEPMAFYIISGLIILRCLFEFDNPNTSKKYYIYGGLIFLGTLFIAAVQLLPAIQLAGLSNRSLGLYFSEATIWSFNPLRLIEFFLPFFYGHNFPYPQYWGVFLQKHTFDVPWAESIYAGVIPFILAFCSLYYSRNKERIYWVSVLIITLLIAFGIYTPVYKVLFTILPYFSSFRYPEKLILFVSFSIIILASYALKDICINKPPKLSYTFIFRLLVFMTVIIFSMFIDFNNVFPLHFMMVSGDVTPEYLNFNCRFKIFYFALILIIFWCSWYYFHKKVSNINYFICFIIFITFLDLFYINTNAYITSRINFYNQKTIATEAINEYWKEKYPPRALFSKHLSKFTNPDKLPLNNPAFLQNFHTFFNLYWLENLIPNRSVIYGVGSFNTVSSLNIGTVSDLSNELFQIDKKLFLKNFNINYILSTDLDIDSYNKYALSTINNKLNVLHIVKELTPRTFFVYNAELFENNNTIKYNFLSQSFDIKNSILLNGLQDNISLDADNFSTAEIIAYSDNEVLISARSKKEGFLILLDSYYPGWKVYVDDKPAQILVADCIYRGVKLSPGKHKVHFIFDPIIVKLGALLTLIGLILGIFLSIKYKTLKIDTQKDDTEYASYETINLMR